MGNVDALPVPARRGGKGASPDAGLGGPKTKRHKKSESCQEISFLRDNWRGESDPPIVAEEASTENVVCDRVSLESRRRCVIKSGGCLPFKSRRRCVKTDSEALRLRLGGVALKQLGSFESLRI